MLRTEIIKQNLAWNDRVNRLKRQLDNAVIVAGMDPANNGIRFTIELNVSEPALLKLNEFQLASVVAQHYASEIVKYRRGRTVCPTS